MKVSSLFSRLTKAPNTDPLPACEVYFDAGVNPKCNHHHHFSVFKAEYPCKTVVRLEKITCCKCNYKAQKVIENYVG